MNKTMIALAVSAAALATGANAAELYNQDGTSLDMGGRAEARLSMKDGKADDLSRVRLNFLGKVDIQDGLYGVGFYEGEFTTADADADEDTGDNGSDIDNRYTYAGLGGTFGEVTYGKNDGALGVITDFTDIMAYHGNSAAYKVETADRADNMLSYKGQFQDLGVKASYRFSDRIENKDGTISETEFDGYSLSGVYAFGTSGFKLGAGYADQNKGKNASEDEYMVAGSYELNELYFAATVVMGTDKDGSNKTDKTGYELAAAYTLDQTVFSTTYNKLEKETSGNKNDTADNLAVDATYYFKPNFRGYVSYNFNLLDKKEVGKLDSEDELALGLRYDF
ncbi:porin [Vibrio splendidus]|uniref:porin n=1 Tax=Vibrio splendidus TaxID=29497 RepID=UPI00021BE573|nr:porin [Vibrio splendidus]EGU44155.1 outer membrane protein OmpU [Vibrio splendidus ATCC 33789]